MRRAPTTARRHVVDRCDAGSSDPWGNDHCCLLREAESSWQAFIVVKLPLIDPVHHDIDSQPAPNMLLSSRQPRPSKVGLATPPASTLSRYIALVSARRPPIVTLFDQVGAVVSVGRGRGLTLWSPRVASIAKLRQLRQCYEGSRSQERARSLRPCRTQIICRRPGSDDRVKSGSLNGY